MWIWTCLKLNEASKSLEASFDFSYYILFTEQFLTLFDELFFGLL